MSKRAPTLWSNISSIAEQCVPTIIENLDRKSSHERFPKTLNDPVWGSVELYPWEVAILDSPLLQRLRGVSQLGLASYVYPGASHSRLEHVLGVVETAQRMMDALARNAENHRRFGRDQDANVPQIGDLDRASTRLAALLHDIGHGPYSHVTESLLRECLPIDFTAAEDSLREHFEGVTSIATSETIAVLLVLSEKMKGVFEHRHFEAVERGHQLAGSIASRILGSRSYLQAGYLSGVISGPIDADKIDYMARDSHHSGFPIGLDFNRLISKLEVIIITSENALNSDLKGRAQRAGGRCYEMGISLSGLGAYEQMIIGRALLYDRLYYHHKVRAAEEMLRELVRTAISEREKAVLPSYFAFASENEFVSVWAGHLTSGFMASGGAAARRIGTSLLSRRIYNRAACFAARFISGLDGLPEQEGKDTRKVQWDSLIQALRADAGADEFARSVFNIAVKIDGVVPELSHAARNLSAEQVLVDFPTNKAKLGRGNDILTRTEAGQVVLPNLFFDAEKGSSAYEQQKLVGYIFAPEEKVPLVALASRIALYERFGIIMGPDADNAAKTTGAINPEWLQLAGGAGICSTECVEALTVEKPNLVHIRADDLKLPDAWKSDDPALAKRLEREFRMALPSGLPAGARRVVIDSIYELVTFADTFEKTGKFTKNDSLAEKLLQQELKSHLLAREVAVREGVEIAGGETDLILYDRVIVENKSRAITADPFEAGTDYGYPLLSKLAE